MPFFKEGHNVAPLTKGEKKWCQDIEKLLLNCPARFGFYTIGDADLNVFDREACEVDGIPQEECEPDNRGYGLASIRSKEQIQGWCG